MRTKILIVAGIAAAGYVLGTRANRPVARESVRHQLVRLWNDPKARKRREQQAKQLQKDAGKTAKRLRKDAGKKAEHLAKAARKRAKDLGR
ncbi:hypothetical protein GCM10009846_04000 [Agrococcus versicolor]|uniref:YtxH domain-containing protein n=1 Tax=Agrococcus versicolor TaxID=501482 RepID=A0ABN3AKJ4_9MICO